MKGLFFPFLEKINIEIVLNEEVRRPTNCRLVFNREGGFMISVGMIDHYPYAQGPLKKWDFETERIVKPDDIFKFVAEDMLEEILVQFGGDNLSRTFIS